MALAVDASTPASTGFTFATTSQVTGAFSPPANSVIFLLVCLNGAANATQAVTSVTDSVGTLVWKRISQATITNALLGGCAEVWYAACPSAQTGMTVTVNCAVTVGGTNGVMGIIQPIVFTGADPMQWGAHSAVSTTTAGAPTTSIVTQRDGSLVLAAITNWTNATAPTVPAGQTVTINGNVSTKTNATAGDAWWAQQQTALTTTHGTSVTMNDTAPSVRYHIAAVEVLATDSHPFVPQGPPTRRRQVLRRLSRTKAVVSTQQAAAPPPFEDWHFSQPRRLRGLYTVRVRRGQFPMPQASPPVTVYSPDNISQPRQLRGLLRRKGKTVDAPLVQDTPIKAKSPTRRLPVLRKRSRAESQSGQQFPVVKAVSQARKPLWIDRRRGAEVIPQQGNAIQSKTPTRRLVFVRRKKLIEVVPTQAVVATPKLTWVISQFRRRGLPTRRSKRVEVVPTQAVVPPPKLTWVISQFRRRGLPTRRADRTEVIPTQVTPRLTWTIKPIRNRGLLARRGKPIEVVSPQDAPIQFESHRVSGFLVRRSRRSEKVREQQNPPYPHQVVRFPRILRGLFSKRTRRQGTDVQEIIVYTASGIEYTIGQARASNQLGFLVSKYELKEMMHGSQLGELVPKYKMGEPQ